MSDEFTCPRCGAAYTREKRRIGKAVVCGCGHRFLVPLAAAPPARRRQDFDRPPQRLQPPAQPAEVPWAEPVAAEEAQPLPEAEVVYAGAPVDGLFDPMDDLFGQHGSYADPMTIGTVLKPLSPRPVPPSSPARGRAERRPKRQPLPVGIVVLALLDFLAGAIILAAGFLVGGLLSLSHASPAIAVMVCGFFASLAVALGVGMLLGSKWAWWLSAFGCAWSVCNGILGIVFSLIFMRRFALGAALPLLMIKYLVRPFISGLILSYLLSENVLAFFRLKRLDTGQALGILFGLAITLQLLLIGAAYLLLHARHVPGF